MTSIVSDENLPFENSKIAETYKADQLPNGTDLIENDGVSGDLKENSFQGLSDSTVANLNEELLHTNTFKKISLENDNF